MQNHLVPHLLVILCLAISAVAADWPQFRGPHRDNSWEETGILETFPKDGLIIKWRHPVGGGWASPVVARGKVFVFDVELSKPAHERLHCYDEKSGKVLWTFSYEEAYGEWSYDPERGAGPTATPIVDGEQIYLLGANGQIHCLNADSGRVIWKKRITPKYEIAEMSCRPSPLIDGDLLILATGAKPGASVLALNKKNGEEIWKALDDTVSNSSPIIITNNGTRQLIVWSSQAITALEPANGKTIWREAMTTSGNDSAATPAFRDGRLLISGLMIDLRGDEKILWPENRAPSKRILSNTSTAYWVGDHLYGARGYGELVCLEAATGKEIWAATNLTKLKNGASIHITPQGDGYFLFTDEGNLIRAKLSTNGYHEISRAHLIDPTWPFAQAKYVYAVPAYANRHIFVRSEAEIICASLEGP
jgi:outer membrane protein assembly factor BamB